jgi:tRNA (guanine-N7-)-methyltransferase
VGKNKLQRFNEISVLPNVYQSAFEEVFNKDFHLKSKWGQEVFNNKAPIVLELGCGKGEYTIGLAQKYPDKNFIGIDIKGARIWKGAKYAYQNQLPNVAFLRTRIEFIRSFFGQGEVNEIWITFPDPQIKKRRNKKRLTAPGFLNAYKHFLVPGGTVHLKTDSVELFDYTQKVIAHNQLDIEFSTNDLYNGEINDDILCIRTFYEQMFIKEGKKITYSRFRLDNVESITGPPDEEG